MTVSPGRLHAPASAAVWYKDTNDQIEVWDTSCGGSTSVWLAWDSPDYHNVQAASAAEPNTTGVNFKTATTASPQNVQHRRRLALRHPGRRRRVDRPWEGRITWLRRITMGTFPHGTRLSVRCRGRGCPGGHTTTVTGARRMRRLLRRLRGHRYRAGDTLLISLTASGWRPERAQIRIRRGRLPRVRLLGS